jgi:hypothetical protein
MGLLSIFKKKGSTLSQYDGNKPPVYNGQTKLNPQSLEGSNLDLDGQTPKKYLDNIPK